jgi:spermidine synthase
LEIRQPGRLRVLLSRQGTFSVYQSSRLFTGFSWDCLSVAAGFGGTPRDILLLGLGGGTVSRQCRKSYPRCRIDGVEWDREVIEAARRFFHLDRVRVNVFHADAISFIANGGRCYDAVLDDVWPGRPGLARPLFSMAAYVSLVARRLRSGGVYAVNLWCGPGRSSEIQKAARLLAPLNSRLWVLTPPRGPTRVLVAAKEKPSPVAVCLARELGLRLETLRRRKP